MTPSSMRSSGKAVCPVLTPTSVPRFVIPPSPSNISKSRMLETTLPLCMHSGEMQLPKRWGSDDENCFPWLVAQHKQQHDHSFCKSRPSTTEGMNWANDHCSIHPSDSKITSKGCGLNSEFDDAGSKSQPRISNLKIGMTFEHVPRSTSPSIFRFARKRQLINGKRKSTLPQTEFEPRHEDGIGMSSPSITCSTKTSWRNGDNTKSQCHDKRTSIFVSTRVTSCKDSESTMTSCKADVCVSPVTDINSNTVHVSTSYKNEYDPSNRRLSTTISTKVFADTLKSSTLLMRVSSKVPRWSMDVERRDVINQLHMLCARQLLKSSPRDMGEMELELEYDRQRQRLGVHVCRANGVGLLSSSISRKVNTHVELCLMPDKEQCHCTRVVRGTCDPTFNEDFTFDLSPCRLMSCGMRVRVYQSGASLCRDWPRRCVGELWLSLARLEETVGKTLIREDLKPKGNNEKNRMLNVSVCYRSRIRKLCITVIRAENLATSRLLKSAPNCRIEVEVTQVKKGALFTQAKHTSLRRRSRNPVFKEAMSFEIADLNNLRDGMTVVCSLVDEGLVTRKRRVLGEVRLGLGASRATEKQQWSNVLQNPGYSITQWHTL